MPGGTVQIYVCPRHARVLISVISVIGSQCVHEGYHIGVHMVRGPGPIVGFCCSNLFDATLVAKTLSHVCNEWHGHTLDGVQAGCNQNRVFKVSVEKGGS